MTRTERLELEAPLPEDLEELHRLYSDPRTWTHLPSGNLGYRFAPEAQRRGLATELARTALATARDTRPELPVVAYLLEHNRASAAVTEKVGLTLRHRGPDAGNPDPSAVRLVFADRALSEEELGATMR